MAIGKLTQSIEPLKRTESVHAQDGDVVVIATIAGHKNLKTTMGYVHTADDRLHQTVANLPTIGTI